MNRSFAWLLLTAGAVPLGIACDAPTENTDAISNDLVTLTATVSGSSTTAVAINQIEVRFRGDLDPDIEPIENGSFDTLLSEPLPAAQLGMACTTDEECSDDFSITCRLGFCSTPTQVDISELECGIYDVRVLGANGQTCEFIANPDNTDLSGDPCTRRADCPDGYLCDFGTCEWNYMGEGLQICFSEGIWELSAHIEPSDDCSLLLAQ